MGSMFDSDVYSRRKHTPWARIQIAAFMREMALNVPSGANHWEHRVELSVLYRPDVASRMWWRVEWTGEDGVRHSADAQELDLCLWRAAEIELKIREKQKRDAEKGKKEGCPDDV
jgi:hypothetical protein